MVNRLLLLGALAAVMAGVGSFHVADDLPAAGTTLAIGFVLLAAWLVGDLFAGSGLPRLTGYLVTGLVIGPGVLGLVDAPVLARLQVVPGTAAALIALTAGLETDLREIRPLAKIIGWMLGLGVMGEPMCRNVRVRGGYRVIATDLDDAPIARLGVHGVEAGHDVGAVVRGSDVVFASLPSGRVLDALLRADPAFKPGRPAARKPAKPNAAARTDHRGRYSTRRRRPCEHVV